VIAETVKAAIRIEFPYKGMACLFCRMPRKVFSLFLVDLRFFAVPDYGTAPKDHSMKTLPFRLYIPLLLYATIDFRLLRFRWLNVFFRYLPGKAFRAR